jgi:hypothetical protein
MGLDWVVPSPPDREPLFAPLLCLLTRLPAFFDGLAGLPGAKGLGLLLPLADARRISHVRQKPSICERAREGLGDIGVPKRAGAIFRRFARIARRGISLPDYIYTLLAIRIIILAIRIIIQVVGAVGAPPLRNLANI